MTNRALFLGKSLEILVINSHRIIRVMICKKVHAQLLYVFRTIAVLKFKPKSFQHVIKTVQSSDFCVVPQFVYGVAKISSF